MGEINIWTSYLIIFLANVLMDVLAVKFIQEVTNKNRFKAGVVSVVIVYLYALSVIFIVKSVWYIIPAALGAFTGTYITVGKKVSENLND